MPDFPRSLLEFQHRFPDEAACAASLREMRWPTGFVCPACGGVRGWALETKAWTYEGAACGKPTSVTAGTVRHGSKLPLTVWFWAASLRATHSTGRSALQIQKQLGIGSYKTAWLLCAKLRRAMVAPGREPLAGLVEVDEAELPCRSKTDLPAGGSGRSHRGSGRSHRGSGRSHRGSGRSPQGKIRLAGAVEVQGDGPGRLRLSVIPEFSAKSLHAFLKGIVAPGATVKTDGAPGATVKTDGAPGATVKTDGWSGDPGAPDVAHDPHVVGKMAAQIVLPWVHRVFSNLKTWALGVDHGLRRQHIQADLDEFVFRFNRRRTRHAAFRTLLGIGVAIKPATDKMLIAPQATG